MAITLTQKAVSQVKGLMEEHNLKDHVVRVAVTAAKADGLTYVLDIVDDPQENDRSFEQDGIRVVVDPRSYLHLKGTRVDYTGSGFAFNNPNAA